MSRPGALGGACGVGPASRGFSGDTTLRLGCSARPIQPSRPTAQTSTATASNATPSQYGHHKNSWLRGLSPTRFAAVRPDDRPARRLPLFALGARRVWPVGDLPSPSAACDVAWPDGWPRWAAIGGRPLASERGQQRVGHFVPATNRKSSAAGPNSQACIPPARADIAA